MSIIRHHASIDSLADFAAGHLDFATHVVIETHINQCAECYVAVRDLEVIGGACLECHPPSAMRGDAMENFWKIANISESASDTENSDTENSKPGTKAEDTSSVLFSASLDNLLPNGLEAVAWRPVVPGIMQKILDDKGQAGSRLRLLKINPGTKIPAHSHQSKELTLLLKGAYKDQTGVYSAGDLSEMGGTDSHSPEAIGDEPCICLIATSSPLVFKSMVDKLFQPLVGL